MSLRFEFKHLRKLKLYLLNFNFLRVKNSLSPVKVNPWNSAILNHFSTFLGVGEISHTYIIKKSIGKTVNTEQIILKCTFY